MFKVEYIRMTDEVDTYSNGVSHTMHKKGTKVNDGQLRTRKYETKDTLNRYCPNWNNRTATLPPHLTSYKSVTIERFTYQHGVNGWKRIN